MLAHEDRMESLVGQDPQATPVHQDSLVSPGYREPKETPASPALDSLDHPELKDSQGPLACQVAQEGQADPGWTVCPDSLEVPAPRESLVSGCQVLRDPQASPEVKDSPDLKETLASLATPDSPDEQASTAAPALKVTLVSPAALELPAHQGPHPSVLRGPPAPLDSLDP